MSIKTGSALRLFVAIYGSPNSLCNLFAIHPNSLYILFSLLTFPALCLSFLCTFLFAYIHCPFFHHFFFSPPDFSFKIFIPSPSRILPSLFIFSDPSFAVQWRASGQSGGPGRDAAWLVTREPNKGRDAAARRCTAGRNAKAPIRRAENAPTLRAPVIQISIHSHMLSDGIMQT